MDLNYDIGKLDDRLKELRQQRQTIDGKIEYLERERRRIMQLRLPTPRDYTYDKLSDKIGRWSPWQPPTSP